MQNIHLDDGHLDISSSGKHVIPVMLAVLAAPWLGLWAWGMWSSRHAEMLAILLGAMTLLGLAIVPWRPLHTRFELRTKRFTIERKGLFPRLLLEGRWDQITRIYLDTQLVSGVAFLVPVLELTDGSKHPLMDGGALRPEQADECIQLLLDTVRKRHPELQGARTLGKD